MNNKPNQSDLPKEAEIEQIIDEQLINEYFSIVMKLDEYGSSPKFTNAIQEHIKANCGKLENQKENGEQTIKYPIITSSITSNYLLFKEYSDMMEKNLSDLLNQLKITPEKFINACQFAREENVPCAFLDYVLSSIEYEDFYFLMLDYKTMLSNEYEEKELSNESKGK